MIVLTTDYMSINSTLYINCPKHMFKSFFPSFAIFSTNPHLLHFAVSSPFEFKNYDLILNLCPELNSISNGQSRRLTASN